MIKVNLLEARMKEKSIWYKDLAKSIGMSYQTLKGRMWNRTQFQLKEIKAIRKILDLTNEQIIEIFF